MMSIFKDMTLGNILLSTILPIIIPIIITWIEINKTKKWSVHQISIELAGIRRHFLANKNVLVKNQSIISLDRIDIEKLLAEDNFLKTISLENLHTLHLTDEIVLDILQTVLIVRNTDLVVNDILKKYFSDNQVNNNANVKKEIIDLINRYDNLIKKIKALEILIEKRKPLIVNKKNKKYVSVWNRKMEEIEKIIQEKPNNCFERTLPLS